MGMAAASRCQRATATVIRVIWSEPIARSKQRWLWMMSQPLNQGGSLICRSFGAGYKFASIAVRHPHPAHVLMLASHLDYSGTIRMHCTMDEPIRLVSLGCLDKDPRVR